MPSNPQNDWLDKELNHKKISEVLENSGAVTTIQPDPDILGATVGQSWLILNGVPNLTTELTDEVTLRANFLAMKLNSLRYHQRRYQELQKVRLKEIGESATLLKALQKGIKVCELEMLYEMESFFLQYKSSLDMLVKILCPVTGLSAGTLSSYGKFGERLVKRLKKFKKTNHKLTVGRIDWLIEEIEKAKSPWLESIITIRDTYSHYRTEINFGFEWDKSVGRIKVPVSVEENHPLNLVMENLTDYLISYCAHFIAISISCLIPLETHIQGMGMMEKRYIGARWQMDLSKAEWKIASNVIREYTEDDIKKAKSFGERENE